ncbi:MAG: substrate-binding domain-containing protein, partial [Clostridiaceae bacterium]|nr:substrate-binding domain-containing protein [Clostridiaceae bacterium]
SVPRDLLLASFGGTLLGRLNRIPLTTASLDHNELGRQAFAACQYLEDNPSVLSVSVKVGCQLVIRASTGDLTPQTGDGSFGQSETLTVAPIDFYDDPDVQDILAMESFIGRCDELDLQILEGLLRHQTYAALAEHLFLAENALKYRLRRMLDWLGLANRQMLLEHLSAYLSAASLQEAVRIKLGERS